MREAPQTLLPKLFKEWEVSHLVFEKDTDAYGRDRDAEIRKLAEKAGVEVVVRTGRTLYDPDELVKANGGKPTMSITQVIKAGEKLTIPRPIPAPTKLPDPGKMPLPKQDAPSDDPDINTRHRHGKDTSYAELAGPKGDFAPPTLEELGMEATTPHRGGESVGRKMLDDLDETYMAKFEKPQTAPTAVPASTTLLSPHMHFGSLSCREFYWRAHEAATKRKGSKPPTSLTGQLLFRDMYFGAQAALGHTFSQTLGNPQVRFVPWYLRSHEGGYLRDNDEAEEWYRRWKFGKTGFPWIDAAMRQLRQEGWIHHLARHAVACFLTRGGCYVHWERGLEVFEEWLLDHEPACNAGNWQWLSCTAFYAQYYRCYSPVAFPQKTDKNGEFVRRYVPELRNLPAKYIYEPWKAPLQDQKKAGVTIKGSGEEEINGMRAYPKPMLDFPKQREFCIQSIKEAYRVGLHGDDPRVADGSWRELFGQKGNDDGPIMHEEELDEGWAEFEEVDSHKRKRAESGAGGRKAQKHA